MTRVMVSGWYGHDNLGDEAILESMVSSIREMDPRTEITVLSSNPAQTARRYRVKSRNRHQSRRNPLSYLSLAGTIIGTDVFVLGGGGFLSDWQYPGVPRMWLRQPLLAKRLGTRVMAFGIGAGPITTPEGMKWTKYALDRFDAVTVRDETSRRVLVEAGVKQNVEVTADPALLLEPSEESRLSEKVSRDDIPYKEQCVGLVITPVFHKETLWPGSLEKYARFRKTCLELIHHIANDIGMNALLIPFQKSIDLPFLEGLRSECDAEGVYVLRGVYSPREILRLIGHLKLLIGNRFHSIMFGAMANVPTIGISIHHKIADFLKDVGLEPYSFPLGDGALVPNTDLDIRMLKDCIEEQLNNAESIRRTIKERIVQLRDGARRNNDILCSLMLGET